MAAGVMITLSSFTKREMMQKIVTLSILTFFLLSGAADAATIIIEDADDIWNPALDDPSFNLDIKPRIKLEYVDLISSIWHPELNDTPDGLNLNIKPRIMLEYVDSINSIWHTKLIPKDAVTDAEIINWSVNNTIFNPGDCVVANVTIKNTGNLSHEFYVGFSVYDPDGRYIAEKYDAPFTSAYLNKDEVSTEVLTWKVPPDAKEGKWDATVAVWDREEGGLLYGEYDRKTKEDAFFVDNPVEKYAILVGINDYPGEGDDLLASVTSMNAMYDLLTIRYGFPYENVFTFTDQSANSVPIVNTFEHIVEEERIDSNDIFMFYFSGHGGNNSTGHEYVLLNDSRVYGGELNVLAEYLRTYHEPTVIMILDSCHSGGMAEDTDIAPDKTGVDTEKTIVLMSVRADEEGLQTYHTSWFTHRLHKALANFADPVVDTDRNSKVSIEEAFAYAENQAFWKHPQMMDHYLTFADNSAQCYIGVW